MLSLILSNTYQNHYKNLEVKGICTYCYILVPYIYIMSHLWLIMFDHIQKRTINKSVKKNKLREQKKVKEDPTKKKKHY